MWQNVSGASSAPHGGLRSCSDAEFLDDRAPRPPDRSRLGARHSERDQDLVWRRASSLLAPPCECSQHSDLRELHGRLTSTSRDRLFSQFAEAFRRGLSPQEQASRRRSIRPSSASANRVCRPKTMAIDTGLRRRDRPTNGRASNPRAVQRFHAFGFMDDFLPRSFS
jgi:hypothetical protein